MKLWLAYVVAWFAVSLIMALVIAGCTQPDVTGPTFAVVCNQDVATTSAGGDGTTTTVGGINVAGRCARPIPGTPRPRRRRASSHDPVVARGGPRPAPRGL